MNLKQMLGVITGRVGDLPNPGNVALVRQAAAEGTVMLINDGTLPLTPGKVALFGTGAIETVTCGTGSGYVFAPYTVSFREGLERAGFTITSSSWLSKAAAASKEANKKDKTLSMLDRRWSGKKILIDDPPIGSADLHEALAADIAIYVIRRNAGEEADRKAVKGDYYLSDQEMTNLRQVAEAFEKTIVVLNTCVIDANFLFEIPGICACLYTGLGGMEAGNAFADVITGKTDPSGRLTDTWAKSYSDYPAAATFSGNDGITLQEDYTEGIYVGYRWFDSMGIDPLFPFGYGLSYTTFRYELLSATADWSAVHLDIAVTNTGAHAGREVVQVYASKPACRLDQPYQELVAYRKTRVLEPGAAETFTIHFPTERLSSFDETRNAYLMEKGTYRIRIGHSSRDTDIAAAIALDEDAVLKCVSDILYPDKELDLVMPPKREAEAIPDSAICLTLSAADCTPEDNTSKIPKTITTYIPESADYESYVNTNAFQLPYPCTEEIVRVKDAPDSTFLDVCEGRVSMEEFVASLEPEVLTRIVTGTLEETPYQTRNRLQKKFRHPSLLQSSGQTTERFMNTLGIPAASLFDGPAGMHVIGSAATGFPVGMTLAATWDSALIEEIGEGYGRDMATYHVTVGLGPGMNIHRDPLCGRNFEYYSEDPLITGKTAAAFTKGVQTIPGRGVSIKHFATNNQEDDRTLLNNTVTTRALREIYLKGFEICVREADPMTVMTSYNRLNGMQTSSNRELVTDLLRGEWGFHGFVMTDWGTQSEKGFDLHAGNDLIMGGYRAETIRDMMKNIAPVFEPNGYVKETVRTSNLGFVKTVITSWGSFHPEAGGKNSVTTIIPPGTDPSVKVIDACERKEAKIRRNAGGGYIVTWFGTNRGAYLSLGDLERSAIRVLTGLMNSAAKDDLYEALGKKK